MTTHQTVSRDQWLKARVDLLAKEKAFTKLRDQLSADRRALPWVKVEDYVFEVPSGKVQLSDLFRGKSQLIIYHLMFNPTWESACKSCSFWADNFANIIVHLNARDTNLAAVSRAPLAKIEGFKKRMGWQFEWVTCGADGAFNHDFGTALTREEIDRPDKNYNYGSTHFGGEDAPGISIFYKDADGGLYHTYSCYSRGLDMLNGAYHYLDIVPKGRDEEGLKPHMQWVRLHDEYGK
jgi:predicted dithiol-disulfide oxidoreductase (DUF899 family)